MLDSNNAKTAHGLIRGSDRFTVVAVIDVGHHGKDAGEVLDGQHRSIPVYSSIASCLQRRSVKIDFCVVGVATKGGVIPDSLRALLKEALLQGMNLVNGLHEYASDIPELAELAKERGLQIVDVRKPKKIKDLHFWTGKIKEVACPKIAVLGTDCALGKRTTTRLLTQEMREAGYKAEMIYTGQTGWMQGAKYGFIFDSTLNDFVSGELEHAVVSCYENERPDIIFIEGQSSLRNPSGPAGAEWLMSADADAVVLQHAPARTHFKGLEDYPLVIPRLEDEIALISMYGVKTVGVALNSAEMTPEDIRKYAAHYESVLHVPVVLPLNNGIKRLVPVFEKFIRNSTI